MSLVRMTAEYGCWPLWQVPDDGIPVNVDAATLPIPSTLAAQLEAWGDSYQQTLHQEYPPWSGFSDVATAATWLQTGSDLAQRLRVALAESGDRVEYHLDAEPPERFVATRKALGQAPQKSRGLWGRLIHRR